MLISMVDLTERYGMVEVWYGRERLVDWFHPNGYVLFILL